MEFSVRAAELASLLESRISNFVTSFQLDEIGRVVSVGDGIARIYGLKEIQVVELAPILISLVISLLVSLIPLGLLFCRNSLIAPYEFTMEKVLFVVRSLKEKLVINLESLLLHGNEDFREKRLKREEIRRKSQNKAHMTRRANPISGGMFNVLFRIWIVLFLLFSVFTVCSLVLGFDLSLIWVKLQSMLLLRSFRFLFSRLLGWEAPLILLCLVAGLGGSSTLHMQDPAGGQPAANPAAEQPSNVPSGASTSGGWTSILGQGDGSEFSVNQPAPTNSTPTSETEENLIPIELQRKKEELHRFIFSQFMHYMGRGLKSWQIQTSPEQIELYNGCVRDIILSLEIGDSVSEYEHWQNHLRTNPTTLYPLFQDYKTKRI